MLGHLLHFRWLLGTGFRFGNRSPALLKEAAHDRLQNMRLLVSASFSLSFGSMGLSQFLQRFGLAMYAARIAFCFFVVPMLKHGMFMGRHKALFS